MDTKKIVGEPGEGCLRTRWQIGPGRWLEVDTYEWETASEYERRIVLQRAAR